MIRVATGSWGWIVSGGSLVVTGVGLCGVVGPWMVLYLLSLSLWIETPETIGMPLALA